MAHGVLPLQSITGIRYSSYRSSGDAFLAPAFQMNVDYNITDANLAWQGRLVFEPYNSVPAPTIDTGTWQEWNAVAASGRWWASGAPGNGTCPQAAPCTWPQILIAFPNAGIHPALGGILFKVGSNWSGFDGNVDKLVFTTAGGVSTTYDFEYEDARAMKQGARATLAGLLPTGTSKTDRAIEKALRDIDKSLAADLWQDGFHLTKKGNKVFDEERQAVIELLKIESPPAAIAGVVASLVAADAVLADVAIDEAVAANGDPKELERAQAAYAAGSAETKPEKAIEHFKKAWNHAMKAIKKAVEP
jgi:hypothetical protein